MTSVGVYTEGDKLNFCFRDGDKLKNGNGSVEVENFDVMSVIMDWTFQNIYTLATLQEDGGDETVIVIKVGNPCIIQDRNGYENNETKEVPLDKLVFNDLIESPVYTIKPANQKNDGKRTPKNIETKITTVTRDGKINERVLTPNPR